MGKCLWILAAVVAGLSMLLGREVVPLAPTDDAAFLAKYGPHAVVFGASQGLGEEWAYGLARRGLGVTLMARREPELMKIVGELQAKFPGQTFDGIAADLAEDDAVSTVAAHCAAKGHEVGLMVYNAAHGAPGGFFAFNDTVMAAKSVKVNILTMMEAVHTFSLPMQARGKGGVVVVGSITGDAVVPFVGVYSSTKAFQKMFGMSLWKDLKDVGVDLLVPILGATRTPSLDKTVKSEGRTDIMEQEVGEVVEESFRALGHRVLIRTGLHNKLLVAFLTSLPYELLLTMQNKASEVFNPLESVIQFL